MQLPVLEHNITPEQAFGTASTLVDSASTAESALQFGALFQIAVLAIGFAYTFFIVRYWDFLRYFITSALGFHHSSGDKAHINPGEQTNIEVVMIVLGVLTLSLCALRGVTQWAEGALVGISGSTAVWVVVLTALFATTIMLVYQYGALYLSATVCERSDIGKALIGLKSLYLAVGFVATIPFGILFLLWQSAPSVVAIVGAGLCGLVAAIIFVKETFLFFLQQKISILRWILYLCALEIFPISLILAPILR